MAVFAVFAVVRTFFFAVAHISLGDHQEATATTICAKQSTKKSFHKPMYLEEVFLKKKDKE